MRTPILPLALGALLAVASAAQQPSYSSSPDLLDTPATAPVGLVSAELAGRPLAEFPHFEHVTTFIEGTSVWAALDLTRRRGIAPGTYSLYVTEHRSPAEWIADPTLLDARGAPQQVQLSVSSIADNVVTVDAGALSGDGGLALGVAYDIVIDADENGSLSSGDVIDGFGEAGFHVTTDPLDTGPLAVTETDYFVSGVKAGFEGQNLFYPTNIASMGELPLVVVSHGNGHDYRWYDHIGNHLASWGFVVMSHENDTGPGIETASTTTLDHMDAFLRGLSQIQGGLLQGHIDQSRTIWIGHSRGGEGITRAYDRLLDGDYVPKTYSISDIIGLSSIAPTTFFDALRSNPHGAPFSLWVGGADADVSGCVSSTATHTFKLHERATSERLTIDLHGAGHGVFHNGNASTVATGPCQISRSLTHDLMRGYLLPLAKHWAESDPAATDFLWRQHEAFRPPSLTVDPCIVVNMTYQARRPDRFVLDDFETQPQDTISSSGGAVTYDVAGLFEGELEDPNSSFTYNVDEFENGMLYSGNGDTASGLVFSWRKDRFIQWDIVPEERDLTKWEWFSMRAMQITRAPQTIGQLGDLNFGVSLIDENGNSGTIEVDALGGGIEEPYQRTGCGTGVGWANFYETLRFRVAAFATDDDVLDLERIASVRFSFGPFFGDGLGHIGIDDLEFTNE